MGSRSPGELRVLTSTRTPLVKRIQALAEGRTAEAEARAVLDGIRLIEEALAAGIRLEVCLYDPAAVPGAPRLAALIGGLRERGVRLVPAAPHVVAAASQVETSPGVVAVAVLPAPDPAAVLDDPALLLVVANAIQDPGNLGAIIRVADAAAATAVAVTGESAHLRHPKTVRATMGSVFHVPVFQTGAGPLISSLQERGIRVLVADPRGALDYAAVDYGTPLALVVGSEAHGPGPQWLAAASTTVRIPIYGRAESLNVAMAAALLLYEARRRPRRSEGER